MKGYRIISAIVLAVLFAGCTQNHGYIGRLFGSWFLYNMTVDGETPAAFDEAELFWGFQSDLIMITKKRPHHNVSKSYGTWTETESTLTLNFTHSDPAHPAGTHGYETPAVLGFGHEEPVQLTYIEKEDNTMTLCRTAADGSEYIYYLKKTR